MKPDFSKLNGLIPCIVQDAQTANVLMLGFMNEEAWAKTNETGKVTFWSRTKKRLWTKGEESGNFLHVVEKYLDCDSDTLLIRANPQGPVCHTGSTSCFGDGYSEKGIQFLTKLQKIINSRKNSADKNSYVKELFDKGRARIAQKVGEEATEVVVATMENASPQAILNEGADLLFHLMILLSEAGLSIEEVIGTLSDRHEVSKCKISSS